MKIISFIEEVSAIENKDLVAFIMSSCTWLTGSWRPEEIGYIFIINDDDICTMSSLCIAPDILEDEDQSYRQSVTIDLAAFDLWESAVFDPASCYWEAVAIVGQEYGCSVFISDIFVRSVPGLLENLIKVQQQL